MNGYPNPIQQGVATFRQGVVLGQAAAQGDPHAQGAALAILGGAALMAHGISRLGGATPPTAGTPKWIGTGPESITPEALAKTQVIGAEPLDVPTFQRRAGDLNFTPAPEMSANAAITERARAAAKRMLARSLAASPADETFVRLERRRAQRLQPPQ